MLLGIDLGTSGVKAGLFDHAGTLLGLGRGSGYRFASPRPGWAECDAAGWWPAIVEAVRAALEAAGGARVGAEVEGAGLSTFFPTIIPMAGDGRPLRPGLLYSDLRSSAQVRAITRLIPLDNYERTIGNRLACGNTGVSSIHWIRDNEPEIFREAAVMGFTNTVAMHRLTGRTVTDWSSASLSGLVDINDPTRWSESLCARLDVAVDRLPRIVGPLEPAGTLTPAAAAELGLASGIPVVCGAGDTVASALGTGILEPGEVFYSSGSTDTLSLVLEAPADDRRWINVGYVQPNRWFGIGSNAAGGLSLDWFCRQVLGRQDAQGIEEAMRAAGAAPSGGLVYLPYLQGERVPIWDPRARGLFLGLTAATTRAEMTLAVLEGAAFSVRHILECLEEMTGERVGSLPAVGGGTRSALWNRIKADVLQRPLEVLRFQETAALGAAVMAGIGAGVHPSAEAAVETVRRSQQRDRVEPDPQRSRAYDRLYRVYRDCYERTRDLMHALGEDSGGD